VLAFLSHTAFGSPVGEAIRTSLGNPQQGSTEWTIAVATGHFGRDPQLSTATRAFILELMAEIGAKEDRLRVVATEMKPWGSIQAGELAQLPHFLPTAPAPSSKGGRDLEATIQQIASSAKGPILVISPGDSILPADGVGTLHGGDGSTPGFKAPLRLEATLELAKPRTLRVIYLEKEGSFTGTSARTPIAFEIPSIKQQESNEIPLARQSSAPETIGPLLICAALAMVVGFLCAHVFFRRPAPVAVAETGGNPEIEAWKEQAGKLQRRLDLMVQDLEETASRLARESQGSQVELRQENVRYQQILGKWDEAAIAYLDGIDRALSVPDSSDEERNHLSRARKQFLANLKIVGLEEIRPEIGQTVVPSLHRVDSTVAASEGSPAGSITQLLSVGYQRGEHIIRQSRVEMASDKA